MSEHVVCVLHNVKKSKFLGRWDTFNVAVTGERCLFARLTSEMAKKAVEEANKQGKAEGKGFMARWGEQLQASLSYGNRYLGMAPDDILKENADNFALSNGDIERIEFREVRKKTDRGQSVRRVYGEVTFKTRSGKAAYELDGYPVDDIAALKTVFGDKVAG